MSIGPEQYPVTNSMVRTKVEYFPQSADYKVKSVWKGSVQGDEIKIDYGQVNAIYKPFICRPAVQPVEGEDVVLFLFRVEGENAYLILHGFQGKITCSTTNEAAGYRSSVKDLLDYDELEGAARVDRLIQLLAGDDAETKASMLRELHNLDMRTYGIKVAPLLTSKDPDIRKNVAGVLGRHRTDGCAQALIDALQDKNPEVREAVVEALWRQDHPGINDALMKLAADENPQVRYEVLFSLSRRECMDALPLYFAGLEDSVPRVRSIAVNAFEWVTCPEAVPRLLQCLADSDPKVRDAVIRVFYVYTRCYEIEPDAAMVSAMQKCLYDENTMVRSGAAHFFNEWGCIVGAANVPGREQIESRLLDMLKSAQRDGELISVNHGLEGVGSERAEPALCKLLTHEDWGVRQSAASALGKVGGPYALSMLEAALRQEQFESARNCFERNIGLIQGRLAVRQP